MSFTIAVRHNLTVTRKLMLDEPDPFVLSPRSVFSLLLFHSGDGRRVNYFLFIDRGTLDSSFTSQLIYSVKYHCKARSLISQADGSAWQIEPLSVLIFEVFYVADRVHTTTSIKHEHYMYVGKAGSLLHKNQANQIPPILPRKCFIF